MKLQYSTFIMPHIGDRYSQCADRFAISKDKPCFAIADGVGASFFPEVWAELVSNDFVDHNELFEDNTVLVREKNLITRWNELVLEKVSNLTDEEKFLVEMSKERCDFAACTFVGLSVDNKMWYCNALGDSYLFVLDKEFKIINSVASQEGHDFDNFPEYFASVHGKNNGTIVSKSGNISEVAYFVLLTDAISDWFIKTTVDKRNTLVNTQDMQAFHSLIEAERANGEMKDDDTTAVIIRVVHDDSEKISVEKLYHTDINQLIINEELAIAKQEAERLAKEAEEKAKQEQSQQAMVTQTYDVPITIVETPSVEMVIENMENNTQADDKETLLEKKLTQFMQTAQDYIKSIMRDIDLSNSRNRKEWNKIKHILDTKMQGAIKEVNNKLSKMQH